MSAAKTKKPKKKAKPAGRQRYSAGAWSEMKWEHELELHKVNMARAELKEMNRIWKTLALGALSTVAGLIFLMLWLAK